MNIEVTRTQAWSSRRGIPHRTSEGVIRITYSGSPFLGPAVLRTLSEVSESQPSSCRRRILNTRKVFRVESQKNRGVRCEFPPPLARFGSRRSPVFHPCCVYPTI